MTRILTVGAVFALAGLLAGCRLGLDVGLDVEADGSGRLAVALSADAEAQRRAAAAGADPLAQVVAAGEELAREGWSTRDRTAEDGTRTVELSVEADGPEALSAQAAELAAALEAPEGRVLEPLAVALVEDRVRVTGGAALQPAEGVAELGLTPAEAAALLEEQDPLDYTVTVRLPAEVLSSSATTVEGSTLVWRVAPGERVDIAAEGVRPRTAWLPLLLGAGAATLLLAGLAAVARRRG